MGNNRTEPKVGEGATILMYSDRQAYEVTEVGEDGNTCKIRPMKCKFIGQSYGDERYEYESNLEAPEETLEWSDRKSKWCKVYHTIQIQKSIQKRLIDKYGWGWHKFLEEECGVAYDDLRINKNDHMSGFKLHKGVTKEYKSMHPISIIFGVMSQYRDPSF